MRRETPWQWIPTLYFAEGIPYFVVNNISVYMFTKMGVPNETMSMYTSLLYLPWVIKPFWSPFVDILKTKRWWIISMEVLMCLSFIALTLSIPRPDASVIASGTTSVGLFIPAIIFFYITAFASATHDIAADGFYMLALPADRQAFFVGIRSTFYRLSSIFGQGILVMIAGQIELSSGNIPFSWRMTMLLASAIFLGITLWHTRFLPVSPEDRAENRDGGGRRIAREFVEAFASFFRKKNIVTALAFLLLYRFSEALMLKMVGPFLLDGKADGGLALSTRTVGFVNGTVGVAALVVGGILGGIFASRKGLRKSLWPMALALTLPCFVYVFLSAAQPSDVWTVSLCIAVEQFGYGFGFQAYMLYMIYFSEGEFKTSHYAICTGFMALSMMIPGMFAGYLWRWAGGYRGFFWLVMAACLVTLAVTFFVKVEPSFGKDKTAAS